jgi:hypothetical protein
LTDAQISADAQTLAGTAVLAAAFQTFATHQITPVDGPGGFSASSNFSYANNSSFTQGSQIYFWALNATNNTTVATAEASVTQQAIAYVPLSISKPFQANQAWAFPSSDTGSVSIDLDGLQTAGAVADFGTIQKNANNTSLATLVPPESSAFPASNSALQLAIVAVPEPSSFILCTIALFATTGMRKRRP